MIESGRLFKPPASHSFDSDREQEGGKVGKDEGLGLFGSLAPDCGAPTQLAGSAHAWAKAGVVPWRRPNDATPNPTKSQLFCST